MRQRTMTKQQQAKHAISEWCADIQWFLERQIDKAPNPACKALVEAMLKETYGWPEYPQ